MVGTLSTRQVVRISNSGTSPLPIRWVGIVGANAKEFDRLRWCPGVLAPGRVCSVPVWFQPQSVGYETARLVVSPGSSGERKSVFLSGNSRVGEVPL
jgi:hypothetical protein